MNATLDRVDAAILARLAALNTKTTGYAGLALVVASYAVPVLVPHVDLWIASLGLPTVVVHALVAIIGGLAALFGRWRTFSRAPTSDVAADVPRPVPLSAVPSQTNAGTAGGRSPTMSTTTAPTMTGEFADALVSAYEANKPAILAAIASQNVSVETFVETAAAAALAKIPVLGTLLGGTVKGLGPQIVAYLGTEENAAYVAVDAWLHAEAVKLGG